MSCFYFASDKLFRILEFCGVAVGSISELISNYSGNVSGEFI